MLAQNVQSSGTGFLFNSGQILTPDGNPVPHVHYSGMTKGMKVYLRADGFSYEFLGGADSIVESHRIDFFWKDARQCTGVASDKSEETVSVINSSGTFSGLSYSQEITYYGVYEGIDVRYRLDENGFKYDFIVSPHADPSQISMIIKGGTSCKLTSEGSIEIGTRFGRFEEQIPYSYYYVNEQLTTAYIFFVEKGAGEFGVESAKWPYGYEVTIDPYPVRSWATFYGGTLADRINGVVETTGGKVFVVGLANSTANIATVGSYQQTYSAGQDAFIAAFDAGGSRLWATYYGGSALDIGNGITQLTDGNLAVLINSSSTGLATPGTHQLNLAGCNDVIVACFDTLGTRLWATYYGGTNCENPYVITATPNAGFVVVGQTGSASGIVTSGAFQPTLSGNPNGFIAKFSAGGILSWGTYCSGNSTGVLYNVCTDNANNIYVAGYTGSTTGIATPGAYETTITAGVDAFLMKFNSSGQRIWGTYIGGNDSDYGYAIAFNPNNNTVAIGGSTMSTNSLSTANAYQTTHNGGIYDAWMATFDTSGVNYYVTYYGGNGSENFKHICPVANEFYAMGNTATSGLPASNGIQTTYGGGVEDGLITTFNSSGSLTWMTYYGGNGSDVFTYAVSLNNSVMYAAGYTLSTNSTAIATAGAHQTSTGGATDGFLLKMLLPAPFTSSLSAGTIPCNGGTAQVVISASGGTAPYTGTGSFNLAAGTYTFYVSDAAAAVDTIVVTLTQPPVLVVTSGSTPILCNGGSSSVSINASGGTGPYAGTGSFIRTSGTYQFIVTDANGCSATTTVTITEPAALVASVSPLPLIPCYGDSVILNINASGGVSPYSGTGTDSVTAGAYTYVITDVNGCADTVSVSLTQPSVLSGAASVTDVLCAGTTTGIIDYTLTGGIAPYNFSWNGGTYVTEDVSGAAAGTYVLLATDSNGCVYRDTAIIAQPGVLNVSLVASNNPSSCGVNDGTIDISVAGGTPGYIFAWSNTATTEDISGLFAGSYSCTVTDANGCTEIVSVALNDPNAPSVLLQLTSDTLCNTDNPVQLTGLPAGGIFTGPFVTGNYFDPVAAGVGTHIIAYTYTDSLGCTGSASDSALVDICLEVPQISNGFFELYPNPANEIVTIEMSDNTSDFRWVLFNSIGEAVAFGNVAGNKFGLDIGTYEAGIYFVLVSNHTDSSTKSFIKQ